MPQILVTLGPKTEHSFGKEMAELFGKALIPIIEKGFGVKDAAFTSVRATSTINEADIQIEVRYTAGTDEYKIGKPFDPTPKEQEVVRKSIKERAARFFSDNGLPQYSTTEWTQPHYGGGFSH
jgi:hypothetical protein